MRGASSRGIGARSVLCVAGPAREGNGLADVVQPRGKEDEALKSKAKTWTRDGVRRGGGGSDERYPTI
jgi:hypothetical protein